MKKRMISFITLAAVVLSSFSFVSASGTISSEPISEEEIAAVQEQSNLEYNRIYQENPMARSTSYPDYYAGAYLDENGELNVLVTDNNTKNQNALKNMTGNQDLLIQKVKYSYQYLQALIQDISNHMDENIKNDSWIISAVLLDDQNCIVVSLKDLTNENITKFKNEVSDSAAIRFEQATEGFETTASMKAGEKITNKAGSGWSIGFRAKRKASDGSYEYGFVTAGHGLSVESTIYKDSTYIGWVSKRQLSGTVDASFVKVTNSSYPMTNVINGSGATLASGGYTSVTVGTPVSKSGYGSGLRTGKVTGTNAAIYADGVRLTDMVLADYYSVSGDSGGIVYKNPTSPYIVGIHVATQSSTGSSAVVKASNILNSLGVIPY